MERMYKYIGQHTKKKVIFDPLGHSVLPDTASEVPE